MDWEFKNDENQITYWMWSPTNHLLHMSSRFAESHFAETHFAEIRFTEIHFAETHFAETHFATVLFKPRPVLL